MTNNMTDPLFSAQKKGEHKGTKRAVKTLVELYWAQEPLEMPPPLKFNNDFYNELEDYRG